MHGMVIGVCYFINNPKLVSIIQHNPTILLSKMLHNEPQIWRPRNSGISQLRSLLATLTRFKQERQ